MPLRDLVVMGVVVVLAIVALRRPWIGLMNWTWVSIMNPHRYTWGFAYSAPVGAIAGGSTLLGLLLTKDRRSPLQGAPAWWLLAFSVWITLSWLQGLDPVGDYQQWNKVIKIYLMTFVALALLHTKHQIMAFIWVTTGSLALLAVKGGLFTIATGGDYRVWGPAGSFIGDNNHFALAVLITIPLLHFIQLQLREAWMRHAITVAMLLCVASAVGSHSRGAFLALGAMGVVFWWRSKRKGLMTVMGLVVVFALLPMMPAHWWERMATIWTYEQDGSAMGRINAWHVAWHTAQRYIFGGGMSYQHPWLFLQYGPYEPNVRAAHSIYFQILGNHGFGGLFLYLMLWISTYRSAGWLRRHARRAAEAAWAADLGAMVQVSLIGFAVGGALLSMPYFDLPYNMMVMVVLLKKWVQREAWKHEEDIPFLEYVGLVKRGPATARGRRLDGRGLPSGPPPRGALPGRLGH